MATESATRNVYDPGGRPRTRVYPAKPKLGLRADKPNVYWHNQVMPRAVLGGRTPDEVYFGKAGTMPTQLADARKRARAERLAANRMLSCEACAVSGASHANLVSAA